MTCFTLLFVNDYLFHNRDFRMSLVSMISMEVAMNVTDVIFTGGAILTWWVIPLMLIAGFITPLPYNYWRLKALGKGCH